MNKKPEGKVVIAVREFPDGDWKLRVEEGMIAQYEKDAAIRLLEVLIATYGAVNVVALTVLGLSYTCNLQVQMLES